MNPNDSHTMFPIVPIETIKTALKRNERAPADQLVAVTAASLGIPLELVQEVADERAGCRGCGACACKREAVEA